MDAARIRSTIDLLNRYIESSGETGRKPAAAGEARKPVARQTAPLPDRPAPSAGHSEPVRTDAPEDFRKAMGIAARHVSPPGAEGPRRVATHTGIRRYLANELVPRGTAARGHNVNVQG